MILSPPKESDESLDFTEWDSVSLLKTERKIKADLIREFAFLPLERDIFFVLMNEFVTICIHIYQEINPPFAPFWVLCAAFRLGVYVCLEDQYNWEMVTSTDGGVLEEMFVFSVCI